MCLEGTQTSGAPPDLVTTRQLADKVLEIYWPHTVPFAVHAPAAVLRQYTTRQAEIVSAITRFRERHARDPSVPRWESRRAAPKAYERLVRLVEWKLIEMPLPRLQIMGRSQRPFIYEICWDQDVEQHEVTGTKLARPAHLTTVCCSSPEWASISYNSPASYGR